MFDQLFKQPQALARQRAGPLTEERLRYLSHLAGQGMARSTLRDVAYYLLVVADFLRLAERPGEAIGHTEIEQKAALWASGLPKSPQGKERPYSRTRFFWNATRWLEFLDRLQRPTPQLSPYADLIDAFVEYMHRDRGLSPETIDLRCRTVQDFLHRLGTPPRLLHEITIMQVDAALVQKVVCGGYARVTVQTCASSLRAFFRYAEMRGWCRKGLATAIKGPHVFPQEPLPAGPSWDQVQCLLANTRGDQPADIRDRALLMLLAIYGLRAGEVVRLHLGDFDWVQEALIVRRSKARKPQTFPLCRLVGDAVLCYLRQVRPRSAHREVFLTLQVPFRPLGRSALTQMVINRLRAMGVSLPHYGPHALRHACATHLLERGLSLKEIGDHLGHQSPETTRIYAKVDLAGLRQVADFDLGGLL
jgi:integrase/recombinase XerD